MSFADILKLTAFFLFFCNVASSEVKISIPNRTIERGKIDTLVVLGDFGKQSFSKLNLVFQFNAYLMDVQKVISDASNIISDSEPQFSVQLNQLFNATLVVTSSQLNLNSNNNAIICKLIVEGLVFKDSVDTIKLVQVELDDNPVSFIYEGGIVTVRGPLVFPVKKNYLSESFPIPASYRVFFRFGMILPSFVEIKVFNSKGEIVLSSATESLFKITGIEGEVSLQTKLDAGDYLMEMTVPSDLASGVYFLQLNAYSVGVFISKFLVIK